MRRTLKVLEGVRDGRGRLGRLLLVGGSELLVFFFFKQKTAYEIVPSLVGSEMCIRDSAVDGGGPQPLGAIVPGLVPRDRRP